MYVLGRFSDIKLLRAGHWLRLSKMMEKINPVGVCQKCVCEVSQQVCSSGAEEKEGWPR